MRTIIIYSTILLLVIIKSSIADTITVNPDGGAEFTNLQDAINQVATLEQAGYKYTSGINETVCPLVNNKYIVGHNTQFLTNVSIGDHISVDGETWYEVEEVFSDNVIIISRNTEVTTYECKSFDIAEVHTIKLAPGSYEGTFDFSGTHFIRILGDGPRESIVISNLDNTLTVTNAQEFNLVDKEPIRNIENYGALFFESITIRNLYGGAVITSLLDDLVYQNTDLYFNDVSLTAVCCDVFYINLGHVQLENSRVVTGIDGIGGDIKSITIKSSTITSKYNPLLKVITPWLSGGISHPLHFKVKYDSLIESSKIDVVDTSISSYGGIATMQGIQLGSTNGATFTILDSEITAIGYGNAAIDLVKDSGDAKLDIINSNINGVGGSNMFDIRLNDGDIVNATCTNIDTYDDLAGGILNLMPCN